MQEKADLLTEIDELKEVKDELTSQVRSLRLPRAFTTLFAPASAFENRKRYYIAF